MMVTKLYIPSLKKEIDVKTEDLNAFEYTPISQLLEVANLCNNAFVDETGAWNGQPTEVAIMELFKEKGFADSRADHAKITEIPFNPEQKWMAVEILKNAQQTSIFYFKGAVEAVLNRCSAIYITDRPVVLMDQEKKDELLRIEQRISSSGLRVLAFGFGQSLDDLNFVGFIGMYDPPRPACSTTISECIRSKIHVAMITGDSGI